MRLARATYLLSCALGLGGCSDATAPEVQTGDNTGGVPAAGAPGSGTGGTGGSGGTAALGTDVGSSSGGLGGGGTAGAVGGAAAGSSGSAGVGGGGSQSNPTPCNQIAGVLYCDDFESGLNPMLKAVQANGGTVLVDQTRPRGGKSSLHVKSLVPAYADGEVRLGSPVFPTANNSFFMRAYVYYAPPAAADNVYLFRLDGVVPTTTTKVNAQMGCEGFPYNKPNDPNFKQLSTLIYHSDIKSADHFAYRTAAAPEVTFGRWACWEWHVDGPNNTWHVSVDGVEHFTRTWDGKAGTPWVVPTATSFAIGVKHDHNESPSGVEVWYDDLVIASSPIGCGPP